MAMNEVPRPAGGGLNTIQDLYNMINGNSTTVTGGTSTSTESTTISQEGMTATLNSILSGNQGLAAVSSGQRNAGGYGSSVNTMLTNDLLARAAGEAARQNTTRTVTQTRAPATTRVGGVTMGGSARLASTLAALQGVARLTGAKDGDLLKKAKDLFGMLGDSSDMNLGAGENASSFNAVNGSDFQSDLYTSNNSNFNSPSFNVSEDLSFGDNSPTFNVSEDLSFGDNLGNSYVEDSGSYGAINGSDFQSDNYVAPSVEFDMTGANIDDWNFADGGEVRTNARQSNSIPIIRSPGINPAVNAPNPVRSVGSAGNNASVGINLNNLQDNIIGGGGGEPAEGSPNANGSFGSVSGSQIGSALGTLGGVMGSPGLSAIGTAIGVSSSANPGQAALGVAANALGLGPVASAINNPSLANVTNIGLSLANPAFGVVNGIANALGIATIGQIAENAIAMANPNNPIGPDQQAQMDADESSAALGGVSGGDSASTDASSMGATNGADSSSDNSGAVGDTSGVGSATGPGSGGDSGNGSGDPGDGSSGGGVGAANGGYITGPGTGISDSIPARLSDGEFVLSADVVEAVGLDKLQALQDKYHVPAAVQKLQQFGKRRR